MINIFDIENSQTHRFGLTAPMWQNLADRTFWITGGGTGYGQALALSLLSAGATVIISGRRLQMLEQTQKKAESLGLSPTNCIALPFDLQNEKEILRACEEVRVRTPHLFGLINNAAVPVRGEAPLLNDSWTSWEQMMRTNVTAAWFLSREIFSHMLKSEGQRILFMTSEAGWANTSGYGPYNISKAAVNSLAMSMAEEFAQKWPEADIQINAFSPGQARTEMNQGSETSPYAIVPMALRLLAQPAGGPNGKFFHRDGRNLRCGFVHEYSKNIMQDTTETSEAEVIEQAQARGAVTAIVRRKKPFHKRLLELWHS